ncbi:MAG: ribbon-helix-helix domain-containing protein [Alphaproteobacteria bacterium]|nr:ribbon-helix-helix domain-containing protein [Alphaproteobacteria bacterium]
MAKREKRKPPRKAPKSYVLDGPVRRRTSLRLEKAFEQAIREICASERISVAHFLGRIRAKSGAKGSFSSRIRCEVLNWYRTRAHGGKP